MSVPGAGQRVLYMVYWGAAEPLGQSLVLPAVRRLASLGSPLDLVTFEKAQDLDNPAEMERIRAELRDSGVTWHPLRYHKRPKWPATLYDVLRGVAEGVRLSMRSRPAIVHARTFVGGLIGRLVSWLVRARLVFHNEGFYPDEQVDGGVWRYGSAAHRLARFIEHGLYRSADGIIVLSERARAQIEMAPDVAARKTPVALVPSCVDLERFAFRGPLPWRPGEELRLIYVGSIGFRYVFERVAELMASALKRGQSTRLRVLTPADLALVETKLDVSGVPRSVWSAARVSHAQMPRELATCHAGVMVLTQGISEHGCSPTKVGEYWAVGLPVVITPNISDTEEIIRSERVGVVIRGPAPGCYDEALERLFALLQDPDLSFRCRRAAERHYSLTRGVEAQQGLYRRLRQPAPPGVT